jgi:hypothetical protein
MSNVMESPDDFSSSFVFDDGGGGLSGFSGLNAAKGWVLPLAIGGSVLLLGLAAVVALVLRKRRKQSHGESISEVPSDTPTSVTNLISVQDEAHWFENPEDDDDLVGMIGHEFSLEPIDDVIAGSAELLMHTKEATLDDEHQDVVTMESGDLFQIDEST